MFEDARPKLSQNYKLVIIILIFKKIEGIILKMANLYPMSNFIQPNYDAILLFPPCVDDMVPKNHKVRFVRDFVRELDLQQLGICMQPANVGRSPYHPGMILAIWLYGYMVNIRSSRKLEDACANHIDFIWLSGYLHPDHNTLSRFFKDNKGIFKKIFKQVIQVAKDLSFVKMILHALDGTKIASVISSKGAFHQERLEKMLSNIDEIINEMLLSTSQEDDNDAQIELLDKICDAQTNREKIRASMQKLEEENTNHFNPKEPDARVVHLSNGSNRFGYNCQAIRDADSGMIVAEDVVNDADDYSLLTKIIDQVKSTLGKVAEVTIADNGYLSGEELAAAESKEYDVLLNIGSFLKDSSKHKNKYYPKSAFIYNENDDNYTCPQGKIMVFEITKTKTIKRKFSSRKYTERYYRCHECSGCPKYNLCTKNKTGRRVTRGPHEKLFEKQVKLQQDENNNIKLKKRGIIIEPFFAFTKEMGLFRRFTYRNFPGVKSQWSMICLSHNINTLYKLWRKSEFNLTDFGIYLHKLLEFA